MRKILFSAVAILALAILSCNKSELEPAQESLYTIKATIDNYGTKSAMNGNTVTWVLNEEVALFKNDGSKVKATVTEVNGIEATLALETGKTADGVVAALYPYNDAASYANDIISTSLDAEFTWAEGENNKAPMAALVTDVENISFKNAGALIALTVNNIPAGYNKISLSSGIAINGATEISFNNGIPSATVTASADANKKTTINFTASEIANNKIFYFPIGATETNTGITIELSNGTTTQKLLDNHAMSKAVRNTRYYKTINFDALGTLPTQLTSSDDIDTKIGSGNTNFILDPNDNDVEITTETTADVQIAVTSNGDTFTLQGVGPKGKVNLSTPAETQTLTLNVPNATVELKPDAGVATFETITATTAENTLIIPAGVTVNNLTVNGGNVRVFGKILYITNGKQSGKVIIYKESGADIPTDLATDKFDVIIPKANVTTVEALKSAISDATDNDVITLGADLTMSEILVIDKNITLDGNGHKLTSTAARAINVETEGKVTIQNLTIKAGERAINIINKAATVNVNNVAATANNNAIMIATSAGAVNLTVQASNLTGLAVINVAGAGAQVKISNTKITNIDANANENYGAITVSGTAENSKVSVDNNSTITTADDSKKAYVFPGSAEVEGVDEIGYVYAAIGDAGFESLAEAINYAKAGQTIKILRDITTSELITINKNITLDLNGKTVTANCKKAFEVYADATIKNGTIWSQARCVDTRKAVKLVLTDVKLEAPTYYPAHGNQQPLTIGGSDNGTEVTMNKVTIDAGTQGYCIISFVKTNLTAENSNLSGYAALYVKVGSAGSEFIFKSSTLSGTTGNNDVEGNEFATIAIEDNNVKVTMDENCSLNSTGTYHKTTYIKEGVTGSTITGPTANQ